MIKASATGKDGRTMIILGLSDENIERMRNDEPISIDLAELGVDARALIFAGGDEITMAGMFAEFIGPETQVTVDPRLAQEET